MKQCKEKKAEAEYQKMKRKKEVRKKWKL